jgi:predicted aspartyl protease
MDGKVTDPVGPKVRAGTEEPCASWSRRRFVARGLLAMVAAAPVLARARIHPTGEIPPGVSAKGAASATPTSGGSGALRAAGAIDDRLTTDVYLNGRGPYRFLVDTGAERTLIAAELAAQLALPQGRRVIVEGILREAPAVLVEIERLRIGSLACPPLQVPVLPRAMLGVDGYLGLDVLDGHRVIFDFRTRTLTVTRPQGFFSALWTRSDEAVVRTLGGSGRLRATNCLVDGVHAAAFVDTGAEVSVSNPALYAALRRHAATRQVALGEVGLYGVTGGSIVGRVTNVEEIRLGDLQLTYWNLVVAGLDVFEVWGLSEQPALLLGMDSLRRFARVTIDYGRKELRFEVASVQPPLPLEATLPPPLTG